MSDRIPFFYCHGTAYLVNLFEVGFSVDMGLRIRWGNQPAVANGTLATVAGINGRTAQTDNSPQADPFPSLLDPNIWEPIKPAYRALAYPMSLSIIEGTNNLVAAINRLKPGTPFAMGGYSQGAATVTGAYLAGLLPGTTGPLESRRSQFLGAVCFGNPRRAVNHRGAVGGTWSGSWDSPGSTTGGGGSFPTTGPVPRLTTAESKWVEFTHPNDMFSSVGATSTGGFWRDANAGFLTMTLGTLVGNFVTQALASAIGLGTSLWNATQAAFAQGANINILDAADKPFTLGGGGHVTYPFLPPVNSSGVTPATTQTIGGVVYSKPAGDTCYQVALRYLDSLAAAYATSSSVLPPTPTAPSTAGWSTTLVPPAA